MGHVVPFLLGAVQRVRVPAHVPSHVGLAAAQRRPDGEGGVGAVQREARVDRRIQDADGDVVTMGKSRDSFATVRTVIIKAEDEISRGTRVAPRLAEARTFSGRCRLGTMTKGSLICDRTQSRRGNSGFRKRGPSLSADRGRSG